MKSTIFILLISLLALGCSEKADYLDKLDPAKSATQEKIGDLEGLTFTPEVDILFVVDDSGSMGTHQDNLSRNMGLFIDELSQDQILDYHIGVISTDMTKATRAGRLVGSPKFIDRSTPGGLSSLQQNIMVGTGGDSTEQMLRPVIEALSFPLVSDYNAGFYRPNAHLAVVFLTDAEDQSAISTDYYIKFLERLKNGEKEKLLTYASFIPVNTLGCARGGENPPVKLEATLILLNAKYYSLCDPDFGTKLAGLAQDLREKVGSFIPLAQLPYPPSIKVTYGTQEIPRDHIKGWQYDPRRVGLKLGKEVEFDQAQPEGTTLKVDFVPADQYPKGYKGK